MVDLESKLARFEVLAKECEQIAELATDSKKRELFIRVGGHYRDLATDLKTAINRLSKVDKGGSPTRQTPGLSMTDTRISSAEKRVVFDGREDRLVDRTQ